VTGRVALSESSRGVRRLVAWSRTVGCMVADE
jgi:hypothetical protein